MVLRALESVRTPVRLVLAGVDPQSHVGAGREVPERHAVVCLPFTPDVRPLYDLLDLVMLPSHSEGLSQAFLEAMALGKPVIASASTGNLDLVTDNQNGRLVPPRDPSGLGRGHRSAAQTTEPPRSGLARRPGGPRARTFRWRGPSNGPFTLYRSLLQGSLRA